MKQFAHTNRKWLSSDLIYPNEMKLSFLMIFEVPLIKHLEDCYPAVRIDRKHKISTYTNTWCIPLLKPLKH